MKNTEKNSMPPPLPDLPNWPGVLKAMLVEKHNGQLTNDAFETKIAEWSAKNALETLSPGFEPKAYEFEQESKKEGLQKFWSARDKYVWAEKDKYEFLFACETWLQRRQSPRWKDVHHKLSEFEPWVYALRLVSGREAKPTDHYLLHDSSPKLIHHPGQVCSDLLSV